jgi:quercetin 2,3-dioxygenase
VIASKDGRHGSATIHQDAAIHAARLDEGKHATLELQPGRRAWLQVARGKVALKGYPLEAGDAVALTGETDITIEAHEPSEVIVFDLPGA